ncbi:hypothetical protein V8D89_001795 [Ganoderma adspersum]
MPRTIRVPLPTNVALDPNFKIDIVDLQNRTIGVKVGSVVDVDAFKATFLPRDGETESDVLFSPTLWSTFMRVNLIGPTTESILGLRIERRDLVSSTDRLPHALCAFISGSPTYSELPDNITIPAPYKDLHDILADVIACQVVWYLRVLRGRSDVVERACAYPGLCGDVWRLWQRACGRYVDYLDALYIVRIRRMLVADTWAYFPEVEIRSTF